ncbi:parafibromin-like [Microplitis mediator]|uniref:parafibromin-like n=1 Tax=Microplitis mediator TaxID=375433 RepID=UPI002556D234|nr:parafibromin-like [Microplitis mediator]
MEPMFTVTMADPLSLLRQYTITKKEIIERGNEIIFGEFSWPKNTKTNYLTYESGKEGTEKKYYTLESLIFFLKHVQLTHPVYVRQAAAENIPSVRRPDRKDLLAYLNGETTTSAAIDKSTPLEIPIQVKRTSEVGPDSGSPKKLKFEETQVQQVKEQLAARLDTPKEASVTVDNIKSLSEALPPETIAAIIVKRIANKRKTIKENDDVHMNSYLQVMVDMDVYNSRDILSRERQWRTRTVILQSNGKIFAKDIFNILQKLNYKITRGVETKAKSPTAPEPFSTPQVIPIRLIQQPAVYNRYVQEKFVKRDDDTEGFKINTMGTYHNMPAKIITEGEGSNPSTESVPKASSSTSVSEQGVKKSKSSNRTPIIIIPNSNSSLITMYNVNEIFGRLKYVTNEEQKAAGVQKKNQIIFQRPKKDGSTVAYQIVDNVQKLSSADWNRVVGVFVLGPVWQFKGWPFDGNPVDIFSRIKAFHIKYDDMKLDANVAGWSVNVIELSRTKRHSDRAAIIKFWETLDHHIAKNKSFLKF